MDGKILLYILSLATFVSAAKPNIVIFLADDLGYGDLGCYGNTSVRTPMIDGIAKDGVKMTQHLTAASVCTPSRAALLTGRYPVRSGMAPRGMFRVFPWPVSSSGLPASEITFAEQTKKAGYINGYIGKWHLGMLRNKPDDFEHHPLNQGFDHFYGLIGTNLEDFGGDSGSKVIVNIRPYWYYELIVIWAVTVSAFWSMKTMQSISTRSCILCILFWSVPVILAWLLMDNFTLLASFLYRNYELIEQPIRLEGLSQRLVQEGAEFVRNNTNSNAPFLLVMAWSHMHVFLNTAKQYKRKSVFGVYGDALEELDWSVGAILAVLEQEGIGNNTLVYFTSDNGGHIELGVEGGNNGVLKGGKSHGAVDGGIRVPGIVKWPGVVPGNTLTDEPTSQLDMFNLISSAVDVKLPDDRHMDGEDILPLLKQQTQTSPHQFLYHYCGNILYGVRYRPRTGNTTWKLVTHEPPLIQGTDQCGFICSCNHGVELSIPLLYDMTSDPGENHPVDINSEMYTTIRDVITNATHIHKHSVVPLETQFSISKLLPRLDWQPCCNGTFPFNCYCVDKKYPS